MIREPTRMSAWDRASDHVVTLAAWGMVILGCFGVWKLADALIALAVWLVDLPPMPGRPW